jgi:hypothetical protein
MSATIALDSPRHTRIRMRVLGTAAVIVTAAGATAFAIAATNNDTTAVKHPTPVESHAHPGELHSELTVYHGRR